MNGILPKTVRKIFNMLKKKKKGRGKGKDESVSLCATKPSCCQRLRQEKSHSPTNTSIIRSTAVQSTL